MASPPHPLSQLTAEEFTKARDVIVKLHGNETNLFFRSIFLDEPKKAELVPFLEAEHAGTLISSTPRPPRQVYIEYDVVTSDRHEYIRAVVGIETLEVVSKESVQAPSWPYYTV